MADIDDVLARLSDDPSFAEQVRADPGDALRDLSLSNDDLVRIEEALGGQERTGPALRHVFRERSSRSPLAYLIGGAVVLGALAGTASGAVGFAAKPDRHVTETPTPVEVRACPSADSPATGTFHRGDRVLLTALDPSGQWVRMRDPRRVDRQVWIERVLVGADKNVKRLPIVDCEGVPAIAAAPAPAVSEQVAPTTASVTVPGVTSTAPASTAAPSSSVIPVPPTPGPTAVVDSAGPAFATVHAAEPDIWQRYAGGTANCRDRTTSIVTASVSDPSGVASVSMAWRVGTASGTTTLSRASGADWSGPVGPFDYQQAGVPEGTADVSVAVTARDGRGNSRTSNLAPPVHLHSASECLG